MKIIACLGFMILGIIIDCGGVPTDDRGYIGARYWYAHFIDVATRKADIATQALALQCIPQRLPRLLYCFRDSVVCLYWNRAYWTSCCRDCQSKKGNSKSFEAGRLAYRHILHCQPLPHWVDRTSEQRLVQSRRFRISWLTLRHCH